jgi:hypothetical protein
MSAYSIWLQREHQMANWGLCRKGQHHASLFMGCHLGCRHRLPWVSPQRRPMTKLNNKKQPVLSGNPIPFQVHCITGCHGIEWLRQKSLCYSRGWVFTAWNKYPFFLGAVSVTRDWEGTKGLREPLFFPSQSEWTLLPEIDTCVTDHALKKTWLNEQRERIFCLWKRLCHQGWFSSIIVTIF